MHSSDDIQDTIQQAAAGTPVADLVGAAQLLACVLALREEATPAAWLSSYAEELGEADPDAVAEQLITSGFAQLAPHGDDADERALEPADRAAGAALVEALDAPSRAALHRDFAMSIGMSAAADAGTMARAQALHYELAGDTQEALARYWASADHNEARGRQVDASRDYSDALRLVPAGDARELLLLERRAVAATNANAPDADGYWLQLVERFAAAGDANRQAMALFHRYWTSGDDDRDAHLRAAAMLGDREHGWSARAAGLLAALECRYADGAAHERVALRHARRSEDRYLEAMALSGSGFNLAYLGRVDEAIAAFRQSLEILRIRHWNRWILLYWLLLMETLNEDLRTREALDECQAAGLYIRENQLDEWRATVSLHMARFLAEAGSHREAYRIASSIGADLKSDPDHHLAVMEATVFAVLLADVASARTQVEQMLDHGERAARSYGLRTAEFELELARYRHRLQNDGPDAVIQHPALDDVDEPVPVLNHALWLSRYGAQRDVPSLVHKAVEIGRRVKPDPRLAQLMWREVLAIEAAIEGGPLEPLEQIVDAWRDAQRGSDERRAAITLGALMARRGESERAAALLADTHRKLVQAGSIGDLPFVTAQLQQIAGGDGAHDLTESDLFRDLDPSARAAIAGATSTSSFSKGEQLLGSDHQDTVFFVRSGRVRLYRGGGDDQLTVAILDPGAVFGTSAVIGVQDAHLRAEGLEDGTLGALEGEQLRDAIQRFPRVGLNLLEFIGSQLQRSQQLAEQVAYWNIRRRVAFQLLEFDARYGHPTLQGDRIINKVFSHVELAEMVGARRQTVTTTLRWLAKEGAIDTRGRRIVVKDLAALRQIAETGESAAAA